MPEVPGVLRLGWLLFMQPTQWRRMLQAWGLEEDPSHWTLRRMWNTRDPSVRRLMGSLANLFLWGTPILTVATVGLLATMGLGVTWGGVVLGVAFGIAFAITVDMSLGMVVGVVFGVTFSVVGNTALGMVAFGMALGAVVGVMGNFAVGLGATFSLALATAYGALSGRDVDLDDLVMAVVLGVTVSLPLLVSFLLTYGRVPFYFGEALWSIGSLVAVGIPRRGLAHRSLAPLPP